MDREIIELAAGSARAVDFEAGALQLLGRRIGYEVSFFSNKAAKAAPTVIGFDAVLSARAAANAAVYSRELLPVKRAALAARGVAVDTEVLGEAQVRLQRYHRDIAAKLNGKHSLFAFCSWRGQVTAAIMLGRTGRAFSAREKALVEELLPSIAIARAAFGFSPSTRPLPAPPAQSWFSNLLPHSGSGLLESRRSRTGLLSVRDRDGFRELVAASGGSELVWTRASVDNPSQSGWPYIELFHLAAALAERRQRALFIGCGGAVALRQYAVVYPGIEIDVVEHDAQVIELARRWFDLEQIPKVTAHVADGADFIRNARSATWDIVVIDAYDATSVANPLLDPCFFAALGRALRAGGAMAFNIIGALSDQDSLGRLLQGVRPNFGDIRVLPVLAPFEKYAPQTLRNIVVVARR